MKRIIGNYEEQSSFPVDCEMLAGIQDNEAIVSVLGNIAGDKVILYGCELDAAETSRAAGYVFLRTADYPQGEIVYWEGGLVGSGAYIKKETVDVDANGVEYPAAYTIRSLVAGAGAETYYWPHFKNIKELTAIQDAIIPIGGIMLWPGDTTSIPIGFKPCNGAYYGIYAYKDLHAIIGDRYNQGVVIGDTFCVPNLAALATSINYIIRVI